MEGQPEALETLPVGRAGRTHNMTTPDKAIVVHGHPMSEIENRDIYLASRLIVAMHRELQMP